MPLSKAFPAAAALLLLAVPALHAAPIPAAAEVVPAARLRAFVAVTSNGLVSHPATTDPASRTLIVRRDGPGEVEVHALLNDVIVVQAGTATLLAGGRVEGGRETAPNERRGGTIAGGRSQALHPGDLVWIPAGIPHQMILKRGGSFTYVAVKTDKAGE
ncbi:MAG: hypothetical protein JWO81_3070 [Alphaproteobacteria bacterium]|nr:hypothetical protein [Alphaproteobacteria bacterium]